MGHVHMKRGSTSLLIRELQIAMRNQFTLVTMAIVKRKIINAGKEVEKLES